MPKGKEEKKTGNCTGKIEVYKLKLQENQTEFQRKIMEGLETLESNLNTEYLEESQFNFKIVILSATETVCGKCRTGRKKKQSPWWTDEVKEEVNKKNQLWQKYLTTKSTEEYKNYKA
jgi:hypothetical protein